MSLNLKEKMMLQNRLTFLSIMDRMRPSLVQGAEKRIHDHLTSRTGELPGAEHQIREIVGYLTGGRLGAQNFKPDVASWIDGDRLGERGRFEFKDNSMTNLERAVDWLPIGDEGRQKLVDASMYSHGHASLTEVVAMLGKHLASETPTVTSDATEDPDRRSFVNASGR